MLKWTAFRGGGACQKVYGEEWVMTVETAKKILVLSDNEGLSRAIELSLKDHMNAKIVSQASEVLEWQALKADNGDFDLIVVAMSSPVNEPIVALTRASLTCYIGQVPLLIISDRPFESAPEDRIVHLDFPFDVDGLHSRVEEMLEAKLA